MVVATSAVLTTVQFASFAFDAEDGGSGSDESAGTGVIGARIGTSDGAAASALSETNGCEGSPGLTILDCMLPITKSAAAASSQRGVESSGHENFQCDEL